MSTENLKQSLATKSTATSTSTKQPSTIFQYLEQHKNQIALALPKHLSADRMARIVTTEVRKVPALLKCNPISLFGAVIQCSQLGLEPGNNLGHAYLLPFKNDVQLIIGYRGMIDLARRSGQVLSINVYEVFDTDEFEVTYGLEPNIIHKRDIKTGGTGNLIAVYAVAKLKDGGCQFEVMTKAQVEDVKKTSQSANSSHSPWKNFYNEMAKKTVIRRLFKYLPVSIEIQQAVTLDENADAGISQANKSILYPDAIDVDDTNIVDGVDQSTGEVMDDKNKLIENTMQLRSIKADAIAELPIATQNNLESMINSNFAYAKLYEIENVHKMLSEL